jgi:hypothetical protein
LAVQGWFDEIVHAATGNRNVMILLRFACNPHIATAIKLGKSLQMK